MAAVAIGITYIMCTRGSGHRLGIPDPEHQHLVARDAEIEMQPPSIQPSEFCNPEFDPYTDGLEQPITIGAKVNTSPDSDGWGAWL